MLCIGLFVFSSNNNRRRSIVLIFGRKPYKQYKYGTKAFAFNSLIPDLSIWPEHPGFWQRWRTLETTVTWTLTIPSTSTRNRCNTVVQVFYNFRLTREFLETYNRNFRKSRQYDCFFFLRSFVRDRGLRITLNERVRRAMGTGNIAVETGTPASDGGPPRRIYRSLAATHMYILFMYNVYLTVV